jgi:hypothetical protein
MGPQGELIFERAYTIYVSETKEPLCFNDFFDKVVLDEKFGEYFDTLFERAKQLLLEERKPQN